ncbi:cupin domain-containing protein [[Erwinia] mediterraneensis]|uniref:cupin domain-containing protein n=1 Tax=[Erwinia] mediterraneensis TaxID=2161819 RepID=UPI0010321FBF|nr:cupin domain-containing protein [[Erwinia] mediterraneensis]
MQIYHGRQQQALSEKRGATFTGEVWADPVMPTTDGVTMNNVFFTPGARTWWHSHEQGQILQVVAGQGWICVAGEQPQKIRSGDSVWIPANERHWHGAAADSYLLHTAISLGKTHWQEEVSDRDYAQPTG